MVSFSDTYTSIVPSHKALWKLEFSAFEELLKKVVGDIINKFSTHIIAGKILSNFVSSNSSLAIKYVVSTFFTCEHNVLFIYSSQITFYWLLITISFFIMCLSNWFVMFHGFFMWDTFCVISCVGRAVIGWSSNSIFFKILYSFNALSKLCTHFAAKISCIFSVFVVLQPDSCIEEC